MSTPPERALRLGSPWTAVRNATILGLLAIAPAATMANTGTVTAPETRVAKVSLADLDLSTADGTRAAYERLHQMARRLCMRLEKDHDLGHQPHFVACVDDSLAKAQLQLNSLKLAAVPAPNSMDK